MTAFVPPLSAIAARSTFLVEAYASSLQPPPQASQRTLPGRVSLRRVLAPATRPRAEPRMATEQLAVMVNGVPGKMAASTAEEVVRRGLILADEALTGAGMELSFSCQGVDVKLAGPAEHAACLARMVAKYPRLIAVDYTHPSACNPNVEAYTNAGISFVVGTTGGDTAAMNAAVEGAPGVYAVIAPNMGKQIVAFQAMMDMMAKQFPGVFSGYAMTVVESHQAMKADTSGTAKAVVQSFNEMGITFDVNEIEKVRTPPESMDRMGVPGKYVTSGHAYHTYHLTSPDGSVNFEFQHNVCGRLVYAAGTVDAVQFLDAQRTVGASKQVFSMIDILRSGSME
jgi:4-hydroxy-tetrahydrodipicolinate reductase